MEFQVLSHAGLKVQSGDYQLLFDPWLLGSCYWRTWWNYPPVEKGLVRSLKPDCIYLTHIHWDHFHGPSLRRFPKDIRIVVPRAPDTRVVDDLRDMGFTNIQELRHGESLQLAPRLKITCWHFGVFLDSCVVIEAEGVTILNANDSKFMGGPLRQVLRHHPPIDFVLRSHSNANSKGSYEITDATEPQREDPSGHVANFADFVRSTGARYAIPFASSHCLLHRDAFHLNDQIQTPKVVSEYFAHEKIESPKLQLMVSGDSWSTESGFKVDSEKYFLARDVALENYKKKKSTTLEKFYKLEERTTLSLNEVQTFFSRLRGAVPWILLRRFRSVDFLFVLRSGTSQRFLFKANLFSGQVTSLSEYQDREFPIQIHGSTYMVKTAMRTRLFSHLSGSKRMLYRVKSDHLKYMRLFNLIINFYEYDYFPLHKCLSMRIFRSWIVRWREVLLYVQLSMDLLMKKRFDFSPYLPPRQPSEENS